MKEVKQKSKILTTQTTAVTIFSIVAGAVVAVGFGPIAGLIAGVGGLIFGISGARSEAKEKANNLLPNGELLEKAKEIYKKTGKKEISFKIKYKNQNKEIPFLGRLIYGDRETFEKTFYFDD